MKLIGKIKKIANKIPDKIKTILQVCLVTFIIVFAVLQAVTLFISSVEGDPYLFPHSLLVKGGLENEPAFKSHISSQGYIIKSLNWVTADRHGSVWSFYIKVQNAPGYNPNNIHHQDKYWDYHTNGNVFYDVETHEIVFSLIDEW